MYDQAIHEIKQRIARGETYQVNFTHQLRAQWAGDPWSLFQAMVQMQPGTCSAYLRCAEFALCSASPELFFMLDQGHLKMRPMKGTAARGRTTREDAAAVRHLQRCEKERAENVMVVDMIRNDMGRVASVGTVRVPRLFEVEKYPTVWQMTSTVTCETTATTGQIMAALFPCASITGAPKVQTMKIIAALEAEPRGIYTGCIGYIAPGRRARFGVAIRTAFVVRPDDAHTEISYGVGGGITWGSQPQAEYEECLNKARVMTQWRQPFQLLESLLWTPLEGYFLLQHHLRRMADSAEYFEFAFNASEVEAALVNIAAELPPHPHKVRLLLDAQGAIHCEASSLAPPAPTVAKTNDTPPPVRLRLAVTPVNSQDVFLFHKTTHRATYDTALANSADCDDVLLWNERQEITETSRCNVALEVEGQLLTPPINCGLLAGTYRAWLLEQGRLHEEVIPLALLHAAPKLYVFNSVRQWQTATLVR